ncbi:MAG TPA: glycosyltransferase family 1 protein [Candidatus Saccharimonadales bacterium]
MAHIAIDARIISTTTGRYVERLLHYLEQIDRSNHYTVLVREKDKDYWKPTNPNFTVKIADFKNYTFSEQTGFLKLLNSLDADLVHFCQPEQPVLYKGKKVTTIHDLTLLKTYNSDKNWLIYHFKQLVGRFVFHRVINTSRAVITPTNFTKNEIINFFKANPEKFTTTHLAAGARTTSKKAYTLPSKNFIMFVGQQSDYKNVRRLTDAHHQLLKKHNDLELVLVGKIDSTAKRTQQYINSKGYTHITFTGFVEDDELNWLYSNAKAYIFPSLMEGFGLPGLEAMNHSLAVVSSNTTCLPEVYEDAAHYFDPLNVNDMARAINEVISDDKLRNTLIKNGSYQVKKYSWEETAKRTHQVYLRALAVEN